MRELEERSKKETGFWRRKEPTPLAPMRVTGFLWDMKWNLVG
jgi:hypothetical protein